MKKKITLLLIIIIGLLSTYAVTQVFNSPKPTTGNEIDDYLPMIDTLESPVQKYGEATSYLQMEEDLVVRIMYPVSDIEPLNQAIDTWITDTLEYYQNESIGSHTDSDRGCAELTIDYSSQIIDERFAAIKLSGIFNHPHYAHPTDVLTTFNADITAGTLLSIEDILAPEGLEKLYSMVIEAANIPENVADYGILNNWLLTPNGLEINLIRGEYLPMSNGTVVLNFTYDELEGIISFENHTVHEEENTETNKEIPSITLPETASIDPNKPMVALTFDDGPSVHTDRLLDIFKANGGLGTFYVVGNMIDSYPETLQRMATEGHEIGGHSWNHRQLTALSYEELKEQLMAPRAKIYEVTGIDSKTIRPPYGSYNDSVKSTAKELGISLINWSVDTLDWKYKDANAVYNSVMDQVSDGDIILCHDLHGTTVDAMEKVIPALIEEGYQLVTVSDLLTCKGNTLEPGAVYCNQ